MRELESNRVEDGAILTYSDASYRLPPDRSPLALVIKSEPFLGLCEVCGAVTGWMCGDCIIDSSGRTKRVLCHERSCIILHTEKRHVL